MFSRTLKTIARFILRDELGRLQGQVRLLDTCFKGWRTAAWLWERYARELHEQLPAARSFDDFFWSLKPEERDVAPDRADRSAPSPQNL